MSDNQITVYVVDYGREFLYMRYTDPASGKRVTRSTETKSRKEAVKVAAKWEAELREGRYKPANRITWAEFREAYEGEVLPGLADGTFSKALAVFASVERLTPVEKLSQLTSERISLWQKKLRDEGKSEASIKSYSAQLKAAVRWANRTGRMTVVPAIPMPKRGGGTKAMKGRPVTTEEFERMLAAIPKVVKAKRTASWKHLMKGLWWSGLRLGEALSLTWDGNGMTVDLTGRRPMLRIPADCHKSNRDTMLPLAPEFAEMLLAVPEAERTGFVFSPDKRRNGGRYSNPGDVGRTITAIGKSAGVKVSDDGKSVKYASAHDLRRAFGTRWSRRIMPPDLQLLMRHSTIATTMLFYVGQDADAAADRLWDAISPETAPQGNSAGNSEESEADTSV